MDNLRKTSVPDGTVRVEIDDPQSLSIRKPAGVIRGWLATRDPEIPETFHFHIAGILLPHRIESREDVELVLTGHTIVGFKIAYDLSYYLPYIHDNRLDVNVILAGCDPHLLPFKVEDRALAICLAAAGEI